MTLKRRKRIKQKSAKTSERDRYYSRLRQIWLPDRQCAAYKRLDGCTGQATEVHHIRGRGVEYMLDVRTWAGMCRHCHDLITFGPQLGRELGLIETRIGTTSPVSGPVVGQDQCGACWVGILWAMDGYRSVPVETTGGYPNDIGGDRTRMLGSAWVRPFELVDGIWQVELVPKATDVELSAWVPHVNNPRCKVAL